MHYDCIHRQRTSGRSLAMLQVVVAIDDGSTEHIRFLHQCALLLIPFSVQFCSLHQGIVAPKPERCLKRPSALLGMFSNSGVLRDGLFTNLAGPIQFLAHPVHSTFVSKYRHLSAPYLILVCITRFSSHYRER